MVQRKKSAAAAAAPTEAAETAAPTTPRARPKTTYAKAPAADTPPAAAVAPAAVPAEVAPPKTRGRKKATDAPGGQAAVAEATPAKPKKAKAATQVAAAPSTKPVLTAEQRHHYVSVAAFYIAERRGFTLGDPAQDWLEAEAEIDRMIASGHFVV